MIIACPACATRYVVPDSAIGVEGRTVRCAKCKHSWYQDGSPLPEREPTSAESPETPAQEPAADAPGETEPEEQVQPSSVEKAMASDQQAEATDSSATDGAASSHKQEAEAAIPPPPPDIAPEPEPGVAPPAATGWDDDPYHDDEVSHFDRAPPFRPRRNWLKVGTWAASIFAVIAIGTVFAASYWGLPDWVPVSKPTFAQPQENLVLEFPPDEQDRRTLPNGSEYFGVSGSVTNVGEQAQRMPSLLIVLRDERQRNVYEWEISPPKSTLSPGETVSINEAVTDIPKSAQSAEFGWKPE